MAVDMMTIRLLRLLIAIFVVSIFVASAFLFGISSRDADTQENENPILRVMSTDVQTEASNLKFRNQRNALSRQLNLMKQLYGQQDCEKLIMLRRHDKEVNTRVSESGGWCSKTSSPNSTKHHWDKGLSTSLSKFLKDKTVASFGDGPGEYKKHIDSLGEVSSYIAYDGAPFCDTVTDGLVEFLDLTVPQYGLPAYDWVVSVEVGEHIPAKYEDIYLDNLVRHAIEGVILSWAVPGQRGLSHVNNKLPEEVIAQMEKRGFRIDQQATLQLQQGSDFKWLKHNINVYRREDPNSFSVDDA